jgi:chitodextrinase
MNKKTFLTAALFAATMMTGINAQVGINTDSPTTTLDIIQTDKATNPGHGFRLDDGNQGGGKILTSDANGTGTWQLASAGALIQGTWSNVNANIPLSTDRNNPTYTGLKATFAPGKYLVFTQIGITAVPERKLHPYVGYTLTQGGPYVSHSFLGNLYTGASEFAYTANYLILKYDFILDLSAQTANTTVYIATCRNVVGYVALGITDSVDDFKINEFGDEYYLNAIKIN